MACFHSNHWLCRYSNSNSNTNELYQWRDTDSRWHLVGPESKPTFDVLSWVGQSFMQLMDNILKMQVVPLSERSHC